MTPWSVRRVPPTRGYVRMGGSYHLDPWALSMISHCALQTHLSYLAGDQMVQHATHDSLPRHDVCACRVPRDHTYHNLTSP